MWERCVYKAIYLFAISAMRSKTLYFTVTVPRRAVEVIFLRRSLSYIIHPYGPDILPLKRSNAPEKHKGE